MLNLKELYLLPYNNARLFFVKTTLTSMVSPALNFIKKTGNQAEQIFITN